MEIKNSRNKTLAADAETSAAMFIRKLPLALAGRFGLLLALDAGLLVMLPLPGFCEDAGTGSHALEPSQSALQRFVIANTYFRHLVFPPLARLLA